MGHVGATPCINLCETVDCLTDIEWCRSEVDKLKRKLKDRLMKVESAPQSTKRE
jgi:hypothetical protein